MMKTGRIRNRSRSTSRSGRKSTKHVKRGGKIRYGTGKETNNRYGRTRRAKIIFLCVVEVIIKDGGKNSNNEYEYEYNKNKIGTNTEF